jgi:hypothetical protein
LINKYGSEANIQEVHHYETIEVKDSNNITIIPEGLEVSSDFNQTYYDYYLKKIVDTEDITRPVTNYEYESKLENEKREIYLLKQEYLSVVIDDVDDIMPYKKGSTEYLNGNLKKAENIRLYQ